ncbi:MAG: peptide/nickel transport system ATP-binding protein ddpF [Subtercola sp.]|nr:peptide/nickel transport system ATP-binding protein ddpF [Subtercola sp.]
MGTNDTGTAGPNPLTGPVLDVRNLTVGFGDRKASTTVVRDVSFSLDPGQCLAIVGESGSGKSVTARSIIGLAGAGAVTGATRLAVNGSDVLSLSPAKLRRLRGADVGFVLQDALVSLDPLRPVGREIADALRLHTNLSVAQRNARVQELLTAVGVPQPEYRARQRSGELSGGLRQRALIASAIALDPPLLIADEPTTALDATVQEQILQLLERLKQQGTAVLLISHDLAVVNRIADRIAVMNNGKIVEEGTAEQILQAPEHEYTKQLIRAIPAGRPRGTTLSATPIRLTERQLQVVGSGTRELAQDARGRADRPAGAPQPTAATSPGGSGSIVLEANNLVKHYRNPDGTKRLVVDNVSLSLPHGTTLGLVGESGSGKTTTARLALGITQPDAGTVNLLGAPWSSLSEAERRPDRRRIGAIYQDALGSFDPRWTVRQLLTDSLTFGASWRGDSQRAEVAELLDAVGLPLAVADRRPLHLSGGQRQRVAIARALAPKPEVIVCDEPVSALDVSVQAQVLDLLDELQRVLHVSYLFISHDLGVVQHVSDTVAVMSEGRIVETGTSEQIFTSPQHDYTRQLLAAAPRLTSRPTL